MRTLLLAKALRACSALLLTLAALTAHAAGPLHTCRLPDVRNDVQCGSLVRPLDPAAPGGKTIEVHYVVLPALARNKQPEPLFFFAGGPGQSAIKLAPQVLQLYGRLNNRRDIVLIDQRGTGKSAPLDCKDVDDPRAPLAQQMDVTQTAPRMQRCLQALQQLPYGDLRQFTTTIAMQDADAVRQQLGYERIDVAGGSYGTRAVLEYLRAFPQHVRRAVIDSVAPPDMVLPLSMSPDAQAAFDAMLSACEKSAPCNTRYPNVRRDWQAVLGSLPKAVTMINPATGKREPLTLTRPMLTGLVRGPLYSPAITSALPDAITAAAQGDFTPLAGLASALGGGGGALKLSWGMHFSVVCAEDYPRMASTPDRPAPDFGDDVARLYAQVCSFWPRGAVPAAFYTMPPAKSPVLVLAGGIDPVTPPRHAEHAATALGAKARLIVVPNAGHNVTPVGCMRDVVYRFFEARDDAQALAVDATCALNVPRPMFYVPPGEPS